MGLVGGVESPALPDRHGAGVRHHAVPRARIWGPGDHTALGDGTGPLAGAGVGFPRSRRLLHLSPRPGYFAAGHAGRGKLFLLAALAAGLSGLVITIAALTLLVKGPCRCCQGGAALVLLPLVLAGLSPLDVLPP